VKNVHYDLLKEGMKKMKNSKLITWICKTFKRKFVCITIIAMIILSIVNWVMLLFGEIDIKGIAMNIYIYSNVILITYNVYSDIEDKRHLYARCFSEQTQTAVIEKKVYDEYLRKSFWLNVLLYLFLSVIVLLVLFLGDDKYDIYSAVIQITITGIELYVYKRILPHDDEIYKLFSLAKSLQ